MEYIYRKILKKSWEITKKYKWLWFFGLFASLLGTSGEVDALLQNQKLANAPEFLANIRDIFTNLDGKALLNNFTNALASSPLGVSFAIALIVGLGLFIIWIATVSQGGLIESIAAIYSKKEAKFKTALNKGKVKFWQLLGLNIITNFLLYFILIILSLPFAVIYLATTSQGALIILTILAFILLTPIAIILSFILKYAFAYVVVDDKPALKAFKDAWKLFINNWLVSIEMAVILFIVNIGVGLLTILALLIVNLPFFAALIIALSINNAALFNVGLSISIILTSLVIMVMVSLLTTFQYSAWTILFMNIKEKKIHPKLIRLLSTNLTK